jgi:hypothetical protein
MQTLQLQVSILFFIFLGVASCCVSLLGLHYSGRQLQTKLFSHSTHSLHVLARTGHPQVNVIVSYEPSYAFLTDPLLRLSLHIYHLL